MKQNTQPPLAGTILAITADMDIDQVLCMRLKSPGGQYPIITYQEVVYTGLDKHHVGNTLLMREVMPQELKAPEHAAVWEQYRRDRPDLDENRLLYVGAEHSLRMFLHLMNDNSECLVVAGAVEVRQEPAGERRYWELGYHYIDLHPYAAGYRG